MKMQTKRERRSGKNAVSFPILVLAVFVAIGALLFLSQTVFQKEKQTDFRNRDSFQGRIYRSFSPSSGIPAFSFDYPNYFPILSPEKQENIQEETYRSKYVESGEIGDYTVLLTARGPYSNPGKKNVNDFVKDVSLSTSTDGSIWEISEVKIRRINGIQYAHYTKDATYPDEKIVYFPTAMGIYSISVAFSPTPEHISAYQYIFSDILDSLVVYPVSPTNTP